MPSSSRWSELLKGRNGLRSLALAGGVAVHAINVYQVTTILPSVVADIGGLAYYAWNMTLFVMASIFGAALSPRRIAVVGLQRAFLHALAIFGLGTIACASAGNMPWLLAGRTIQGLGGGLLLGLSYSAVRLVFEERLWPRAMVLVSSMWGISTLIGPTIGGIFAQAGLWRWAFWSMLPIIALLALLVHTQLADGRKQPASAARAPLGRISVLALTVMLVSAASVAHDWRWNAAGIVAGSLLTAWVAIRDARSTGNTRLLPEGGWTPGHPLAALYACVALLSLAVTVEVFIPYFLQVIHGQSPLIAGYFMASMSFGWTTGSFMNAGRSARTTTMLVKAGPVISAASVLSLAVAMPLPLAGVPGGAAWLLLPLLGTGLGIGLAWSHILTRVFQHAPRGQENIASAAVITVQLYALALGGALAGMITNAAGLVSPGGIQGAMQAAVAVFLCFAIGPILAAILIRRHHW